MAAKAKAKSEPAAGLAVEVVPIDSIHADPANVRQHPERNLAAIKASLARFKQQKPLVVDADGIVRAGNGTLEAARSLGWESIAIVRTPLRGSEATAYAIADNRTGDLGGFDDTALAETLRSLQSEDFDLAGVGYTEDEVDALIERLAGEVVNDPQAEWEGMPEFEHEDKTAFQSIHVHFKDQAAVDEFARLVGQNLTANTRSIWYPQIEIESYADKAYTGREGDES
jgi:hypothetical protein